MAGFETIVRPMVLPNIRPATAQPVGPVDDPNQGKAVISGTSSGTFTNTFSQQVSIQTASAREQKRQFDEVRIRGTFGGAGGGEGGEGRAAARAATDDDMYIDVEVVNKLWLKQGGEIDFTRHYSRIDEDAANVTVMRRNVTRISE